MMGLMVMPHGRSAPGLAVCALLLAGCTSEPETDSPQTTIAPTTAETTSEDPASEPVSEEPSESADPTDAATSLPPLEFEVPPEFPEAAATHDEAGAEAFVAYFVDVLNYAQRQNDPEILRAISDAECMFCNLTLEDLDALKENGWRRIGGQAVFRPSATVFQEEGELYVVRGELTFTDTTNYDSEGKVLSHHEATALEHGTFVVGVEDGTWVLFALGGEEVAE